MVFIYCNPFFHLKFDNFTYIISPHGPRGKWVKFPRIHYIIKKNDFKTNPSVLTYQEWVNLYSKLDNEKRLNIKKYIQSFPENPKISIVLPVYNPNIRWLKEAIDSVRAQLYPNWELCIADDCSLNQQVRDTIIDYAKNDPRIKFVFREINGHISAASNSAIQITTAEWVALIDQDDVISEDALYHVSLAILNNPSAKIIYTDEDKIDLSGSHYDPHFKTSWNYELFKSYNFISHLGVYHKQSMIEAGSFRHGLEGAQDYDLVLRMFELFGNSAFHHIPKVLYHWRSHTESTALSIHNKKYIFEATKTALNSHFDRIKIKAKCEINNDGLNRIRYSLYEREPLVSIIIPTHYTNHLIKNCIKSVIKKTNYKNYEILVIDNTPGDLQCHQLIKRLNNKTKKINYIKYDIEFNYSKINNYGVRHSRGEVICFLNNDTEVITPEWLDEMISHANRTDVGAVGCMLLYPNNLVQHGGIIMGINQQAGHAFKYFDHEDRGYMSRLCVVQNYCAVTGACLVTNRKKFEQVGGFDEINFPIALNDVDLCLKLMNIGYNNVWTPFAKLYHHEGASRGSDDNSSENKRFRKELIFLRSKYSQIFEEDPFYNPNLTLQAEDFSFASPPRLKNI